MLRKVPKANYNSFINTHRAPRDSALVLTVTAMVTARPGRQLAVFFEVFAYVRIKY